MPAANYSDYQTEIYLAGLAGRRPQLPFLFDELEALACQKMDPKVFGYVAGGAGDEHTQRANMAEFARWQLLPRMFAGSAARDLSIELFGQRLPTPLMLCPIGVLGLLRKDGDLEAAQAAMLTGVPLIVSTLSSVRMEELTPSLAGGFSLFQLYMPNDRELAESFIRRAEKAGFGALVITADTGLTAWRPRDLMNAFRPQWAGECVANYFSDPVFRSRLARPPEEDIPNAMTYWRTIFANPAFTWHDLEWVRSLTRLPLLVKGICHPDDARRAIDCGVDGIICSNHGGRQVNSGTPSLVCLPKIVEVADEYPVLFDSGIRSGVDVVKALALGARAVCLGRPYCYGLALGGCEGVVHIIRSILAEADITIALVGCHRPSELPVERHGSS